MDEQLNFETLPFDLNMAVAGEIFEVEGERGRSRRASAAKSGARSSRRGGKGAKRPRSAAVARKKTAGRRASPVRARSGATPRPSRPIGSERIRWIQDCLNRVLELDLQVTGIMWTDSRSAVRSFQKQQGLRVTGIVGPDTEEALRAACRSGADTQPTEDNEFDEIFEAEYPGAFLNESPDMEPPQQFNPDLGRARQNKACWSRRNCAGKRIGKYVHAHQCWNKGGKSHGGEDGDECINKTTREIGGLFDEEYTGTFLRGTPEKELPAEFSDHYNRLLSRLSDSDRKLWETSRCYPLSNYSSAPKQGGVYLLIFKRPLHDGHIGYVGMAGDLRKRMYSYFWYARSLGLVHSDYAFCFYAMGANYFTDAGDIEDRLRVALRDASLVTNPTELELDQGLWEDS